MQFLGHLFLLLLFSSIYILSFIIIKPFLFHKTRKISTFLLKSSYLLYLFILLTGLYLFIFFSPKDMENKLTDFIFIIISIFTFSPNFGIIFRRNFKKQKRIYYNYACTILNLLVTIFLLRKLFIHNWFVFIN